MNGADVARLLSSARFRQGTEALLQKDIEDFLYRSQIRFDREVRLTPGERIDFMVGSVGIEAKIRVDKRAIFRQLTRYARFERISSLVLISGTALGLPRAIEGKPVYFVSLGRSAL